MFCTNCGKEVTDGQRFCTSCGAPLPIGKNSQQDGVQQQASAFPQQTNQQMQYVGQQPGQMNQPAQYVNQMTQPASQQMPYANQTGAVSDKSKTAAALFSLFLGGLGIHRFYVGRVGSGIAMLLLTIFGAILAIAFIGVLMLIAVGIWDLVDFIMILTGSFTDGKGRKLAN